MDNLNNWMRKLLHTASMLQKIDDKTLLLPASFATRKLCKFAPLYILWERAPAHFLEKLATLLYI
jgi:hypothetical protein